MPCRLPLILAQLPVLLIKQLLFLIHLVELELLEANVAAARVPCCTLPHAHVVLLVLADSGHVARKAASTRLARATSRSRLSVEVRVCILSSLQSLYYIDIVAVR